MSGPGENTVAATARATIREANEIVRRGYDELLTVTLLKRIAELEHRNAELQFEVERAQYAAHAAERVAKLERDRAALQRKRKR